MGPHFRSSIIFLLTTLPWLFERTLISFFAEESPWLDASAPLYPAPFPAQIAHDLGN
jgi:hypothetical protein